MNRLSLAPRLVFAPQADAGTGLDPKKLSSQPPASPLPASQLNPAGLENEAAEKRAEERRKKQAAAAVSAEEAAKTAEVEAQIAEEKEKARKAALLPKIEAKRNGARKAVAAARDHLETLRAQLREGEVAIGDLEGAIITAGDVARTDPDRAEAGLDRAWAKFKGTNLNK